MKMTITLGIIIILFLSSFSFNTIGEEQDLSVIYYVDNDGTVQYTRIQDALDNASNGSSIHVLSGTYHEHIVIDKSITIIGENDNTTIIDGNHQQSIITITADHVTIKGLVLRNTALDQIYAGIDIQSNFNTITNNRISESNRGIITHNSQSCAIFNNNITNVVTGIHLDQFSCDITVADNNINEVLSTGIVIQHHSNNNKIKRNYISNTAEFLQIRESQDNNIFLNSVKNHIGKVLMFIDSSENNVITNNNFIYDGKLIVHEFEKSNIFSGNFWGRSRIFPRFIVGWKTEDCHIWMPFVNVDLQPAKEPYEID